MNLVKTIIFLCLCKCAFLTMFENIRYSQRLEGFTFKQLPGISFGDCWMECEQRKGCKSINFMRRSNMCFLNSENDDGDNAKVLTEAVGFVYKPKKNIPNNVQVKCLSILLVYILTVWRIRLFLNV